MELNSPGEGEIEISVFSRGYGESICIHIGDSRWIIIDSLTEKDGTPAALKYLNSIGVTPDRVTAVLLTHWHDDHVRGAAQIVDACTDAVIAISSVLRHDEFKAFLRRTPSAAISRTTSGVDELMSIIKCLNQRGKSPHFCMANRKILEEFNDAALSFEALSPCDNDFLQMLERIAAVVVPDGVAMRLPAPSRNDISVVTTIQVSGRMFLFGADLEVSKEGYGWHALHGDAWRKRGRADFYKVAHHGSVTGEFPPIWEEFLRPDVMTVLTPWSRGTKLPKATDVQRIAGQTRNCFAASKVRQPKSSFAAAAVQRSLKDADIQVYREPNETGHIRFRSHGEDQWKVDFVSGDSCSLAEVFG